LGGTTNSDKPLEVEAGLGLMLLCPLLQVRVRRIQFFPLFEDYNRVHIGSVTQSQVGDYVIHNPANMQSPNTCTNQ